MGVSLLSRLTVIVIFLQRKRTITELRNVFVENVFIEGVHEKRKWCKRSSVTVDVCVLIEVYVFESKTKY